MSSKKPQLSNINPQCSVKYFYNLFKAGKVYFRTGIIILKLLQRVHGHIVLKFSYKCQKLVKYLNKNVPATSKKSIIIMQWSMCACLKFV